MEPLRSYEPEIDTCAERRASRRVRVTCPATLQTMTTMTHGNVANISETGARFEATEPPGKGATALLKWGKHEAVCTIIWHDDGACGVWFKQKLAPEIVAETAALDRVLEIPIASVGNITQGRKRSMPFLKRAAEEPEAVSQIAEAAQVEKAATIPPAPEPKADLVFMPTNPAPDVFVPDDEQEASAEERGLDDELLDAPAEASETDIARLELETPLDPEPPASEAPAEPVHELVLEPPVFDPPVPEHGSFGRAGGLPPPTIGHSPTLAEVLKRYRETGSWER